MSTSPTDPIRALEDARRSWQKLGASTPWTTLPTLPGPMHEHLLVHVRDAEQYVADLRRVLEDLDTQAMTPSSAPRYSEDWWDDLRMRIETTSAHDAQAAAGAWLEAMADAFIDLDLTAATRLATAPFVTPIRELIELAVYESGAQALSAGSPGDAVAAFDLAAADILDPGRRALLLVLASRAELSGSEGTSEDMIERSLRRLAEAKRLAPNDGRVVAARGDVLRIAGRTDDARKEYERAISLSPTEPDGYLGLGALFQSQRLWDLADDHFAQAIDVVRKRAPSDRIEHGLHALLAPVTGNTYLQLARMLRRTAPTEALGAIERALERKVEHQGDAPDRLATRLRAEILDDLGQYDDAAREYGSAALGYLNRSEPQIAIDLLKRAREIGPDRIYTYWLLADALRMRSETLGLTPAGESAIREARDVWDAGATIRWPDASDSWAFATRALIDDRLAHTPGEDAITLLWQSMCSLERACLLSPDDEYRLIDLSRGYRRLRLAANSIVTSARAVEMASQMEAAWEERVIVLANQGRFADAAAALDTHEQLSGSTKFWHHAVRGYLHFHQGDPAEAIKELDIGIAQEPTALWSRDTRADCYRELGEPDRARTDLEAIWNAYDPTKPDDQLMWGIAAYKLGTLDDAIRVLTPLRESPTDSPSAQLYLGMCQLQRGDHARAEATIAGGMADASTPELYVLTSVEFRELERSPIDRALLGPMLSRLRARANERMSEISTISADDELDATVATSERASTPWIGANAGLARRAFAAQRWWTAANIYRDLLEASDAIPEARSGLAKALEGLAGEGCKRFADGQHDTALATFRNILSMDTVAEVDAVTILADECRKTLPNAETYWALDAALKSAGAAFNQVRAAMREYLIGELEMNVESAARMLVVTPISVDLSPDLVPDDTSQSSPLFARYLPGMQAALFASMGVRVPGVRFRTSDDLTSSYVISLDEVPTVLTPAVGRARFYIANEHTLTERGVAPVSLVAGKHPSTGAEGHWLLPEHWAAADAGTPIPWLDPMQFVTADIEALARRRLSSFLGVQEVEALVASWGKTPDHRDRVESALADLSARLRLGRVLRALVKEQVPITDWRAILTAFERAPANAVDDGDVVRATRMALREFLPGNAPGIRRLALPADVERVLRAHIVDRDGKRFLAIPAEETREALSDIRTLVGDQDPRSLVLLVDDGAVRPHVRRLVELEFPLLMVIAREEALDEEQP